MKRFLLSLYLLLSVGFAAAPFSLEKRSVRHYTINEGLASNAVYSMHQDSKGLIWIGTIDGLHSFDGYRIREWRDPSLPSLGAVITDICEDGRDRLWVGSRNGLSILDLRKEKFHSLDINPESGVGINASVTGIICDSGGDMWLSTDAGVFRYDLDTKMLRQYPAVSKIRSDMVRCIMEDSRGRIWAGTQQGLCLYNKVHDRFIPSGNYARVDVSTLFEDNKGVIWVGSRGAGLYRLSGSDGSLECVLHPADSNSLLNVRSIVEREPGELLIASDQGLTVFDTNDGSSRILRSENTDNKLNDNYIHTLFIDREKALWIGTYFGGINYVAPEENMFRSYHIGNADMGAKIVSVIAKAKNDNLWIGTDDAGVFHWNRAENRFTPLGNRKLGEGSAFKNIHALLETGDKLFVGMYLGGLDIIDLKTGVTRNHTIGNSSRSLYSSSTYSLLHDSRGNIWVGTPSGLNRYCPETDDFERVFEVHPADVTCLIEDAGGNIWACTSNAGIFRLNSSSGKWVQLNPGDDTGAEGGSQSMSVITASCDATGNVWFGMDGDGLYRYDHKSETLKKEGVPPNIRVVNKIIPFGDDLWLATSKGLWRYNPASGAASYYDKYSGLQDNVFLPNSGIREGESVFVGSVNGFNEFKPAEIRKTVHNPEVILSDLQIFNKPVKVDAEGSPLKESITYADCLVLSHNELVISFRVSPLSYVNPSANKIEYKLDGFDKDWIDEDPSIPITYTNLPSGNYTFRVRTSDGTGGWNEEALTFPVTVLPPWWFSTPMIIIYLVLFVGILAYCYLRLLHRQKEKLRVLADQKDRELYRSKMEFFTHIIHEIRTPLTLILSPLDQLLATSDNSGSRQQLKVMKRNGERLLNLVNHLMDFRKMESKESVDLNISDHDIAERLRHICENFSPAAHAKGLKVETIIPAGRCMAKVDPEAFTQIVSNLLSNALKFARSSISVKLSKFTPPHQDFWRLMVTNDGPAIPVEEQDKIFTAFYQISDSLPTDNIGTGLGLLLVKRYANLMDCEVRVESGKETDVSFIVDFKASEVKPAREFPNATQHPGMKEIASGGENDQESRLETEIQRARLLVVDDNSDMLEFLSGIFAPEYEVTVAPDVAHASSILASSSPDLIISDVMMPGVDGMEFCRRLKADLTTSHIPVVLLTAKVDTSDCVEGLESGADIYVTKPFSPDVIKSQVRSLLRNRDIMRKKFMKHPETISETLPEKSVDRQFFDKVREVVEKRISDAGFTVDALAADVAVSRTGLFAKIKAVTGMTPNDYIRKIRLQKAAALLSGTGMRVNEVCWEVGFSSRSHFAKCFHDEYGMSPSEYKTASVTEAVVRPAFQATGAGKDLNR